MIDAVSPLAATTPRRRARGLKGAPGLVARIVAPWVYCAIQILDAGGRVVVVVVVVAVVVVVVVVVGRLLHL